jgi:hypothetical protein
MDIEFGTFFQRFLVEVDNKPSAEFVGDHLVQITSCSFEVIAFSLPHGPGSGGYSQFNDRSNQVWTS